MPEALLGREIRCLLFDLGDTLWYRRDQASWDQQEEASNVYAIRLLRQRLSLAHLADLDDRSLGQRLRRTFDLAIGEAIRRAPLLEPDAGEVIASVLQNWGLVGVDHELGVFIFEALRVRVPLSRPLFPDALATLSELRRRGFLLGIVTNRLWGGQAFYEDLEAIGLLEYFDLASIAISGDMGIRKPNPQIFLSVLDALGVAPQEAAMVGDSLSADILGAQPLGICAIWRPKQWLYSWAFEHSWSERGETQRVPLVLSAQSFPGSDTADSQLPVAPNQAGSFLTTDDDVMREQLSRAYLEQYRNGEIRPERVIGRLAELLEIFPEGSS